MVTISPVYYKKYSKLDAFSTFYMNFYILNVDQGKTSTSPSNTC
jgi:hypothetical protein